MAFDQRDEVGSVTLLGTHHVPEHLCGGSVYLRRYNKCSPLPFLHIKKEIILLGDRSTCCPELLPDSKMATSQTSDLTITIPIPLQLHIQANLKCPTTTTTSALQ